MNSCARSRIAAGSSSPRRTLHGNPALEVAAKSLSEDEFSLEIDEQPLIGRTISHYRLVAKLGSGGMGEVYRAVRDDGTYEKQVAVKVIQSGLGSGYFIARFKTERQILARLDHPNIARILDAGTTADGLHYVVMEYVDGLPIDQYCQKDQLGVRERLKLFWAVCLAVQYATNTWSCIVTSSRGIFSSRPKASRSCLISVLPKSPSRVRATAPASRPRPPFR